MSSSAAFGQADLSSSEREQIHLAGSIQPHGLLLVLREPALRIVQASRSASQLLQRPLDLLLLSHLHELGGDVDGRLRALLAAGGLREPQPLRCTVGGQAFEGALHRSSTDTLVLELEPVGAPAVGPPSADINPTLLAQRLSAAVQRFSEASSIGMLADVVVQCVRDIVGYDRVMVYRFDPDGHTKIIAEARDPRLEPLLGHRYPANDIPQSACELYLRNRVRVLVDATAEPSALVPRLLPGGAAGLDGDLDMSQCFLRGVSPLHLQHLQNMGVAATFVISVVREGALWGLIACHHHLPRRLPFAVRAACELLGETISTRIAAIEHYARAQLASQVRRLEQRLVEATSTEGDWQPALFRSPHVLLQPLDATGAVLFHDGEILTCGEVPSTPELRALRHWIEQQPAAGPVSTGSIGIAQPALASLTPTASGVLAVRLSSTKPDFLVWLRKEQLQSYTWAGDPTKPVLDNDPQTLLPQQPLSVWSEVVRGASAPWTPSDLALASAFGEALAGIIMQVHAVRLLIAEHQLARVRATVADATQAVVVAAASGGAFHANAAFFSLAGRDTHECQSLDEMAALFEPQSACRQMLGHVRAEQRAWRGEMALALRDGSFLPVSLRAEPVPARDGSNLGFIFIFEDLTPFKQADEARAQLEAQLSRAGRGAIAADGSDLLGAIIANAGLAAMDIADGGTAPAVAALLHEVETATARATTLYAQMRAFGQASRAAE